MKTKATLFIIGLSIAGLVGGCNIFGTGQEGRCEGSLTLQHPIPDTTVMAGDTLFIDLANPPVFVSSEGRVTYFYSIVSGISYVNVAIITKYNNEIKSDHLQIIARESGDSVVELQASSGCLKNSTTMNITITEP